MTEPTPIPDPVPVVIPSAEAGDPALKDLAAALLSIAEVLIPMHAQMQMVTAQQAELNAMVHQYRPLLEAATSSPLARGLATLRRPGRVEVH